MDRIDRSTTTQANAALIQEQADAIKATAQAVINIAENYYGEGIPQHEMGAVFAKLEGVIGLALNIGAEAGLLITADEYHQRTVARLKSRVGAADVLEAAVAAGVIDQESIEELEQQGGAG